ncbi:MAG: hypothetical protein H0T10_02465 [Actinobacteria bacterium]|nr:hypothetical protein [Actinomycetota bacterium]
MSASLSGRPHAAAITRKGDDEEPRSLRARPLASSPLAAALTPVAGVTQVRIVLNGGLGGATFDNVFMGEN